MYTQHTEYVNYNLLGLCSHKNYSYKQEAFKASQFVLSSYLASAWSAELKLVQIAQFSIFYLVLVLPSKLPLHVNINNVVCNLP